MSPASGSPSLTPLAAASARCGSPPKRLAATHSMAMGSLDMTDRMGDVEASGVPRGEGLGTDGWGKLGGLETRPIYLGKADGGFVSCPIYRR